MRPLATLLLALVFVGGAAAATFSFSVTTASPITLATVTLNGIDQTKSFSIVDSVAYTGGSNTAGWNVQVAAGQPTSGTNKLPALQVTAGSAACAGGTCTNPTNTVAYPLTVGSTAARLFNANANTGKGTFNLTSTFLMTYPSNIVLGTYTVTVTLTGTTGP